MEYLNKLQWRYATKRFDKSRKLNSTQVDNLLQAANLAPTSYGLQPFAIAMVTDDKVKEKLSPAAFNQPQVTEASHLFIFSARTDLTDRDVEQYIERIANTRGIPKESLADFDQTMKGTIKNLQPEQRFQWAARQAYISLGMLLSAAALQDIDACPMEGFNNDQFDEILGLKEKGFSTLAMVAAGYRSAKDEYQHYKKVRKSLDEFVINY
ncbi:NAD(P)H-dependent oxidoreductase [Thermophagus xiamenensis]|uniref:Nitroreductase n=1 Tax=Thermophagus xiamenensis TaxID=385682 RepID=A0A1I1WYT2_9BACT|nr:NAD(P)H-dependent oxidoreductase [Thermophagus xiamenensis]SFE00222.1 Nitroreductase [Thermophagus xiamenensis]